MTTSTTSSGLSPEAKEFVPIVQILPSLPTQIPLYIGENTIASVYSTEQQPIIYPLIKIPEIDFHIPSSNNESTSQIVLLPTPECYPGPPMSTFYPIDYSIPQTKPNRISLFHSQRRNNNQSLFQNNSHHEQISNSKRTTKKKDQSRSIQQQQQQQKKQENSNGNDIQFKFRSEDFPTLKISDNIPIQPSTSMDTKPIPSWTSIVSTPPPPRSDRSSSSTKKPSEEKRPHSLTKKPSEEKPSQTSTNNKNQNDTAQTKKQKRLKRQKNKTKEELPSPLPPSSSSAAAVLPESIPFSLDDESAFPTLGQEVSTSESKKAENTKETNTPGLINKAKIKAKHAFEIRFTDMFNALNTSIQSKQQNSNNKTNKLSKTTITSANPLDSNPVPKRGKEREQPKPRKPTKLKRIINKELEENQKQRQQLLSKPKETDITNDLLHININEPSSASGTEESNADTGDDDDDDDDDDDGNLDHEPTSQLQTPYAQQIPQSNIKQQIHDAGFREYCSQLIDRQLDELCIQLLSTLKRFQDRKKQQFQSNPERARTKRRFVHGIREVTKHLRLQRLKCILIAPNCQSIQTQGGLNDAIEQIINLCKEQNIPYIFTLNRQKLGRCLNKISRISAIGIFDYSGADDIYKKIIEITNENQRAYNQILEHEETLPTTTITTSHGLNSKEFYRILHRTFQQQQQPQPKHHIINKIPKESLSNVLPKVPAHYAHSRQTSDTSTIFIDPQVINSIKKQHTRASSGTFDMGNTTKKTHQRTLSDGAATIDDTSIHIKHHTKTHSRTPSGCSAISQIEQQDYFEQSKNILLNNNANTNDEALLDNDENRLKSIHEDTEENSAQIKRKNVEKWINDN